MMTIRVRVKKVDHDGFNGRDHHPLAKDEGVSGTVMNIDLIPPHGDEEHGTQVFYTKLDNDNLVELMGHEIELLSCTHDGDL